MFARLKPPIATIIPFHSGEEAWFWTMAALMARQDGASVAWRPDGPSRSCEPDDIIKCLDTLYQRQQIDLVHARILRLWGERQIAPQDDRRGNASDIRLWQQAMGPLEWALRGRGIVR